MTIEEAKRFMRGHWPVRWRGREAFIENVMSGNIVTIIAAPIPGKKPRRMAVDVKHLHGQEPGETARKTKMPLDKHAQHTLI